VSLLAISSQTETLRFDRRTGRLLSFRSRAAPDQELLASTPQHPALVLQYLDRRGAYQQLTSFDAQGIRIARRLCQGTTTLSLRFERLAGLDLDVSAEIRASRREPGTRWKLAIRNQAGLTIVDLQFPFLVVRSDLGGSILWPHYAGQLLENPKPESLAPDTPAAWQFRPENGSSFHYPGYVFAQFMAFYTRQAGLFLACEDAAAHVKLIRPVYRDPGIRLGLAHVGDWPRRGSRTLDYDVVLRAFSGDWYDAADLYRSWTLQQPWATPLHRRTDVPAWLLDSPAYITVRPQGELDIGPVFPVKEFLPYDKVIPLLDRVAKAIRAPLVAVLMAWERAGPWVYPDCFPPLGGDAAMRRFSTLARTRGWQTGSYCNGTRWVLGHLWNGYDGHDYFREHRGAQGICRTPAGEPWQEQWDKSWRPSFTGCLGARQTRQIAEAFVERLLRWGMTSIQFFDQNMGASTFPCFSARHGHPPAPGRWMADAMRIMMARFRAAARRAGAAEVIHSTEAPCNETCLPLFQECDVRVIPPGHTSNYLFLPLYHYLYHECIVLQGGMGMGPEPHHLETRNACNAVLGQLPGAVLTGDGSLLNKDTGNWAPWKPKVGSDQAGLEMIRTTLALRRGPGRPFLVLGRMLRPAAVQGIATIVWERDGRAHRIPAVFHAAWQSPDGRFGLVLANWTSRPRTIRLADRRLGANWLEHRSGKTLTQQRRSGRRAGGRIAITVPARGCTLLEGVRAASQSRKATQEPITSYQSLFPRPSPSNPPAEA
jgi:hypothetical protein